MSVVPARIAFVTVLACVSLLAEAAVCTVAAIPLAFGAYDPFRVTHTDSTGNIAVTCTGTAGEGVSYTVALSAGVAGGFAPRRLSSPSLSQINYNIYTSAARITVWGNAAAGTLIVTDAYALPATSSTRNYPTYGRIFSGQKTTPVGSYSDAIVITLLF